LRQPVLHRAAPYVADRQRQRIGRVGGPGRLSEPEQAGDHGRDLRLVGLTRPGDGRLDLARRVRAHRQPGPGRREQRDGAGLRGAHDRAHVVLAEDPLDGHLLGPVRGDQRGDLAVEVQQPCGQVGLRVGAHDLDGDQRARPARPTLDDADAAPGQPGVDAEHAHRAPSPSNTGSTLAAGGRRAGSDTRAHGLRPGRPGSRAARVLTSRP